MLISELPDNVLWVMVGREVIVNEKFLIRALEGLGHEAWQDITFRLESEKPAKRNVTCGGCRLKLDLIHQLVNAAR